MTHQGPNGGYSKGRADTMTGKTDAFSLTGKLLLAMPGMADPRFHRSVIFMCAHDANGAMGLVINNVLPGVDFGTLLGQLNIDTPKELRAAPKLQVLSGGPVESARGFVLHSQEYTQKDTVRIEGGFGVTGTVDALKAIAENRGPEKMLFILGYSGWGAGQLDKELQDNAWLVTEAEAGVIFGTEADHKWDMAIRKMGIDPAMLSGEAGRA
jgi:putative transcriptional regulator